MSLASETSDLATRVGSAVKLASWFPIPFTYQGTIAVLVGKSFVVVPFAGTIEAITGRLNTASAGGDTFFDVNKNGTTIFGTQANRPKFASAATLTVGAFSVTTFAANDRFSIDADSIASTPGADATLTLWLRRTL